jgi:hypothetical protein
MQSACQPKAKPGQHDVKVRGALDDLHDFVAVRVALSRAFAGKFDDVVALSR